MEQYRVAIREAERLNGIPSGLLFNLLREESKNFDPDVISGKGRNTIGVIGIAGLTPEMIAKYGQVDRYDPYHSIYIAGKILYRLYIGFGSWRIAVMAYNWGTQSTVNHSRGLLTKPTRETTEFISKVVSGVQL